MTYTEKVEALREKYGPRAREVLAGYGEAFRAEGYTWDGTITCFDCDQYAWAITLLRPGTWKEGDDWPENAIDATFTICEQSHYELVEEGGVTFRLDIVEASGRILGEQTPYNYTPECWLPLDATGAIEERFQLFESTDPAAAVAIVENQ